MQVERSVLERYSQGAQQRVEALCCPVDYDSRLLALLPEEIIERDYGCGDPSRYVQAGDTVLDLGSGGGKICYMAAQLVGAHGHVIGVDMNDDMLALARRHQQDMAARIGGDRVSFHKGYIQDLALDVTALERYLSEHPVRSHADYQALRAWENAQRRSAPLIADASIDLVISNCVLNLVAERDRQQMLQEIFRVLKPGGRVAISDIVSDRPVPEALKQDPELWSGCVSGAFQEAGFAGAFAAAGFENICFDKRDAQPWRVVQGIEFRSVTLTGCKPPRVDAAAPDRRLMYRGPFAVVIDDSGRSWPRGTPQPAGAQRAATLLHALCGNAFLDLDTPRQQELPVAAKGCCGPGEPGGCC
jgi:arsenite methyltransferase